MKIFLTLILTSFSLVVFGQTNRTELTKSNIFYTGKYVDEENSNKSIILREFVKDTIINDKTFKKYQTTEFIDYNQPETKSSYFETFDKNTYIKLDQNLKPIHSVNTALEEQNGIIFGELQNIKLEYVDTRRSFPRDSLIPDEQTPKKFYETKNPNNYIIVRTDLKVKELEFQDTVYTKQLLGDIFWKISENIKNKLIVNNKFNNKVGDEIQLVYRRKWYNEENENAEYEDKQFKNFKIEKIETVNNRQIITLVENGYSFLSGMEEQGQEWKITITDSAYVFDEFEIPIKDYQTELKIFDNTIFLQAVSEAKIGNKKFPLINQYYSEGYYNPTLLSFFPMLYYEVGNVEGYISYAKLDNVEYGKKLKRTYPKEHTGMWSINQVSNNSIEIHFFVVEDSEIEIEFGKEENKKSIFKKKLKAGEYKEILKTGDLKPNEYYGINFNYKNENSMGNQTNGLYAK